jgi:Meckel syndrome type 1 protein
MAPEDPPRDVLSSLPRTRPQRRSAKRGPAKRPAAAENGAASAAAAKAAPRTAAKAAPKKAAATPARARKPAAKPAAKPAGRAAATPGVRSVPGRIPAAGFAPPRDAGERSTPSGVELVGTAIQAAGELAQIGIAVGGQALKSALGRLGRS